MEKKAVDENQLDSILNVLIQFSQGNFNVQGEILDNDHSLNAVISGLNMLGEELSHFQKQSKIQNDFLQNILGSIEEVVYARNLSYETLSIGNFTFISERCLEIIGQSNTAVSNCPDLWLNSIHADDHHIYQEGINKLFNGLDVVLLYRIYHPIKKSYRWIEDSIISKKDSDDLLIHIYGSARDVTKQQQNIIELERKNEFISRMIASSDQFFYIVALDPDDMFVNNFTYLSWQIEKIQGTTVEEMKKSSRGWINLIHPDDLGKLAEDNRRMFSTGKPTTRIYRVKHAHRDEYIWLEDYVVPVSDHSGQIKELYGSARDINARMIGELERERLNNELNHRYNELMQFSYIVSHNLRSPISNIMALSKLINNDTSLEESEIMIRYMQESAERMDDQLRDLNIILSAKSDINRKKELLNLKDVIDTVCYTLTKEIRETTTVFKINIALDAQEIVTIKSYMHSIFFNLISNSIKYRQEGRYPIIYISIKKDHNDTIIMFSDNGIGIDLKTNSETIFGIYNRFEHTQKGTGLGLYMTKTQIETLGGSITVESTPGEGTTFKIVL